MTDRSVSLLRDTLGEMLADRGDHAPLADHDSLFLSGRLDSLAATQVMMMLEEEFGIDLADADFDITRLDSLAELEMLVKAAA